MDGDWGLEKCVCAVGKAQGDRPREAQPAREREVFYFVSAGQYLVQKIDQEVFVWLGAEQLFETKIRKWVDVFVL